MHRKITIAFASCIAIFALFHGPIVAQNRAGSIESQKQGDATISNSEIVIENALLQLMDIRNIPAQANGILSQVSVVEGTLVRQNGLLATIDESEATELLKEATIDHEIAEARKNSTVELDYATKSKEVDVAEYQRGIDSNREFEGVVSAPEMDRLRLRVERSTAEIEKIRFEHTILNKTALQKESIKRQRQIELERHQIRSAIDGIVMEINHQQGEWVNRSDTVFKVVRLNRLRVEEYLPSAVANQDLVGADVQFVHAPNDKITTTFTGKVVFVNPDENPLNQTVRVWIEIENPTLALKAGMKGRIVIRQNRLAKQPKNN